MAETTFRELAAGLPPDIRELFQNIFGKITTSFDELNALAGAGAVKADLVKLHAMTATAAEINKLAGVTAGAVLASKGLVVGANREIATLGPITGDGDVFIAKTLTSATPDTDRLIRSEMTLTPAASLAVNGGGSLAAVRGCMTLTSGRSITGGFLYGAQGKLVGDGATIAVGSGHVCGLLAQLSLNGAILTNGHVAALIVSGQNLPASSYANAIYVESGGNAINAVIQSLCKANFFADIDIMGGSGASAIVSNTGTALGNGAKGWIKVQVNDGAGPVTRYIPLIDTVS